MNRAAVIYGVLIGLFLLTCAGLAAAQDEDVQLRLLDVDPSAFPTIRVTFLTSGETSAPVEDLSQLALSENGSPITDVSLTTNPQGVDVTFVLDANVGFDEVDDDSGLTRAAESAREHPPLRGISYGSAKDWTASPLWCRMKAGWTAVSCSRTRPGPRK